MIIEKSRPRILNWEVRSAEPYHMGDSLRDIPDSLAACLDPDILRPLQSALAEVKPARIFTVGCGTSYNACQALAYTCRNQFDIPAEAYDAYDFKMDKIYGVDEKALVISISHSGQALESCLAQEKAKSLGAFTVGISANPDSRLVKSADIGLADPYPHEFRPRGKIRSYLTSTLLGLLTAAFVSAPQIRGDFLRRCEDLVPFMRRNMPEWEKTGRALGSRLAGVTTRYILAGFGIHKANADEFGLKIIEVIGESATSYGLEEFIHGPAASFRKDMGVLLFQTDARTLEKTVEIARGIAVSEAELIVITDKPEAGWPQKAHVIPTFYQEQYAPIELLAAAVPAQYLLYFLTIAKGTNPDVNCTDKHPELVEVSAIFFPPGTH